jgi:hypothetical protein
MKMRDYTYLDNGRFWIANIYRTKRFDIDRLDINWSSNDQNHDFVRGFRIVDHDENVRVLVHGSDADDLIFSMQHINQRETSSEKDFEEYILKCLETRKYLVLEHAKPAAQIREEVLH